MAANIIPIDRSKSISEILEALEVNFSILLDEVEDSGGWQDFLSEETKQSLLNSVSRARLLDNRNLLVRKDERRNTDLNEQGNLVYKEGNSVSSNYFHLPVGYDEVSITVGKPYRPFKVAIYTASEVLKSITTYTSDQKITLGRDLMLLSYPADSVLKVEIGEPTSWTPAPEDLLSFFDFLTHVEDNMHVTAEDRAKWDNPDLSMIDLTGLVTEAMHNDHVSNTSTHVTYEEKELWNSYSQTSAEALLNYTLKSVFQDHATNSNIHVTPTERSNWNSKLSTIRIDNKRDNSEITFWFGTQAQFDALGTNYTSGRVYGIIEPI